MATKATETQAADVLRKVEAAHNIHTFDEYGPALVEDWDDRDWVIIWEGGPEGWVYATEKYNTDAAWTEPVNNSVLAIYPKDV